MSRRVLTMAVLPLLAVLAGCAGDTKPATNIQPHQAQLNATGHTNNGPAYWWWEYGISRSAVAGGTGTKTPRLGPASSASDVTVNTVVKNLDSGQVYYFRACGQDQQAGSAATCGHVTSFTTPLNDSTLDVKGSTATYIANPANAHNVAVGAGNVIRGPVRGPRVTVEERGVAEQGGQASDIVSPAGTCPLVSLYFAFNDAGRCPYSGDPAASVRLSAYDDILDASGFAADGTFTADLLDGDDVATGPPNGISTIHGGPGDDTITGVDDIAGDDGNDTLTSTPVASGADQGALLEGDGGNDILTGNDDNDAYQAGDGDDTLYTSHGNDSFNCGPGNDTIIVGIKPNDSDNLTVDSSCENIDVTWCQPFCPTPFTGKGGATAWRLRGPATITAAGVRSRAPSG